MADPASADIVAQIGQWFAANGMGDLWAGAQGYLQQGYADTDTIMFALSKDPQYQAAYDKRFAANVTRRKQGLPELKPSEYIGLETSYLEALRNSGLPSGFYDQKSDVNDWIAKDVSPQEVADRVTTARDMSMNADPATKQALQDYYGVGEDGIAAYFLDPERAAPILQRQAQAARLGGVAANAGLKESKNFIEEILSSGTGSADQQAQALTQAGAEDANIQRLSDIYGVDYNANDMVRESLGMSGSSDASAKRKKMASQERAQYSATAGAAQTALSTDRVGAI